MRIWEQTRQNDAESAGFCYLQRTQNGEMGFGYKRNAWRRQQTKETFRLNLWKDKSFW